MFYLGIIFKETDEFMYMRVFCREIGLFYIKLLRPEDVFIIGSSSITKINFCVGVSKASF